MIARKWFTLFVLVCLIATGAVLGEAASYQYGYSSFDTGTGSNNWYSTGNGNSWSLNWGWYKPLPSTGTNPPTKPETPKPPVEEPQEPPIAGLTAEESEAINLVNAARKANGLPPLQVNMELVRLARIKAKDMAMNSYFNHISPTLGSPFDMLRAAGINYKWAGENIARAGSVKAAHNAYMDSPGHRANILNSAYTEIGIGIYRSGKTMWQSQFFLRAR
ncbi:MAG: CAP domain-containing protein [Limnochordia bacterium]